ncbi:hypothetical protein GA830_10285 [Mesorhizobium sp. NBSH29]|uniref:hypothetical protein n=1 Tax=Mesorhizobium sp. NBSH29 TaxID=2654249 RepID=UPI001896679A|nr:hypothetical protein [Mesorhizobium sp. NBSH29]QPC87083.1 hypothetical protein GA830_10285 [Mesorhizobium sp. NBSH29]
MTEKPPIADQERHYATFDASHEYSGCYVEIISESHHTARLFMMKAHGSRWSQQVYSAEWLAGHAGFYRLATVMQRATIGGGTVLFDVVGGAL